jgi:hypothetical protein
VSAEVVVRDHAGVRWRVLDMTPNATNGGGRWRFDFPPAAHATRRCFIARVNGRKVVRMITRIADDRWDALDPATLGEQLAGAVPPF